MDACGPTVRGDLQEPFVGTGSGGSCRDEPGGRPEADLVRGQVGRESAAERFDRLGASSLVLPVEHPTEQAEDELLCFLTVRP
jgi:hypothetical protein